MNPTIFRRAASFAALVALALFLSACGAGDAEPESVTYELMDGAAAGTVTGTVTFTEIDEATTEVVIDLDGSVDGASYPSHIHRGDVGSGGAIVVSLAPVDGTTELSTTTVTRFDDGTAVTYDELVAYDGYVNVHQSATALGTIVATGEVGAGASASP